MLENQQVHDRAEQRQPALRRAAGIRRPRDHLHRAGPAGRPLVRRHEARHRRDRLRDPGAAVPRDRHQGQGRHPHGRLPRPRELTRERPHARRASAPSTSCSRPTSAATTSSATLAAEAKRAASEPAREASWLYAREIVDGVIDNRDEIDEQITTFAKDWSLARMPAVDRALLRIGVWEILYNDEVPDGRRDRRGRRARQGVLDRRLRRVRPRRPRQRIARSS